jgi:hypothetical protein
VSHGTHAEEFMSFAAEMAGAPVLFRRLLAKHVPGGGGQCVACTMRGSQKQTAWPCSLWHVAARAREIHQAYRVKSAG